MSHIAILDCAIKTPSIHCYNQLIRKLQRPLSYHRPPINGMSSVYADRPAGWIIFGSASDVHERLEWQVDLAVHQMGQILGGVPVLGICFGHQLIADAFGCTIGHIDAHEARKGIREIRILEDMMGLKKGQRLSVFTAHSYEVKNITEDFIHFGTSHECTYDALALKDLPYFGFQGHPEASRFFAEAEIMKGLSEVGIQNGLNDGIQIIQAFMKEVEKT